MTFIVGLTSNATIRLPEFTCSTPDCCVFDINSYGITYISQQPTAITPINCCFQGLLESGDPAIIYTVDTRIEGNFTFFVHGTSDIGEYNETAEISIEIIVLPPFQPPEDNEAPEFEESPICPVLEIDFENKKRSGIYTC